MILRYQDVCLFDSGWNLDQDVSAHLLDVLIWLPVRTTAHPMCYNYTTTAHQCFLDALASLGSMLSLAYLGHISDIFWACLGNILTLSWEYYWHILGIFWAYFGHSGIHLAHLICQFLAFFLAIYKRNIGGWKTPVQISWKPLLVLTIFCIRWFFSIFGDYNDFCAMVYRIWLIFLWGNFQQ